MSFNSRLYSAFVLALAPIVVLAGALVLVTSVVARVLHDILCFCSRSTKTPAADAVTAATQRMRHHHWSVGGVPTEVLEWRPTTPPGSDDELVLLLFPGNPGAPQFYKIFCNEIFERSGGALRVLCVSHAAHSARAAAASGPRYLYDLDAQVAHKLECAAEVLRRHPAAKLVLAGHSVGAHCVLECARLLPADAIRACLLLFPTVMHIGATRNGRRLTPLFQWLRPAAWLGAAGFAVLPPPLQRRVAHLLVPESRHASNAATHEATLSLLHPQVATNALHMALAEMRQIRALADPAALRAVESKLLFYFAAQDDWVNEEDVASVRALFPAATVQRCRDGHRHAFVLSEAASRSMGAKSWEWIRGAGERAAVAAPAAAAAAAVPRRPRAGSSGQRIRGAGATSSAKESH